MCIYIHGEVFSACQVSQIGVEWDTFHLMIYKLGQLKKDRKQRCTSIQSKPLHQPYAICKDGCTCWVQSPSLYKRLVKESCLSVYMSPLSDLNKKCIIAVFCLHRHYENRNQSPVLMLQVANKETWIFDLSLHLKMLHQWCPQEEAHQWHHWSRQARSSPGAAPVYMAVEVEHTEHHL